MGRRWMGWVAVVAVASASLPAGAVTYQWRSGGTVPGVDGWVHAIFTWDPDGNGPAGEWLIVGGQFKVAGDIVAGNVAAWDGQTWHSLGDGFDWDVFSLAICNGQLVAGGLFEHSGDIECRHVARFNGTAWEPLGYDLDDTVYSLVVYEGQLIAGSSPGTIWDEVQHRYVSWRGISGWDGQQWQPFAAPLPGSGSAYVNCMAVYNDQLIVAGDLDDATGPMGCIARWDGRSWQPMGDGLDEEIDLGQEYISNLFVYDQRLFVTKYVEDWDSGQIEVRGIVASWNGNDWDILRQEDGSAPAAMAVYKGRLACLCAYPLVGGGSLACWNG